jgi:MFS family permease
MPKRGGAGAPSSPRRPDLQFPLQLLLRLAAGLGSAATFIGGAALVAKLGDRAPRRPGTLLAIYTAGAGAGIVISGFLVQPVLAVTGPGGWRLAWIALTALAGASLLAAAPSLLRVADPDPPAGPPISNSSGA